MNRVVVVALLPAIPLFGQNCTYQANPDGFLGREAAVRSQVYETARVWKGARATAVSQIPRRNFIDQEIFAKLEKAGVAPAALTTDAEFVRRIYLDLTGRTPTPSQIREFLEDPTESYRKRWLLVDKLLYSAEFNDRWTMWLGDLVQNNRTSTAVSQQETGRNVMYDYLRASMAREKSVRDIAWELVNGNTCNYDEGPANFAVKSIVAGGPVQDRYDNMMVRTATMFLGLSHYDCLVCHNGRGHLDEVSLWGAKTTRLDAYKMAAFFSRMDIRGRPAPQGDYYFNSFDVSNRATGNYALNTNYGNRPVRTPFGTMTTVNPEYRTGAAPKLTDDWRAFFADQLTEDPLFAINFANRLWKQMFNLGLVDPVDSLDPARLDPANPPPAPWALQATHPELLLKLAQAFRDNYFNIRETLRLIVTSSAYQLSSRYDGAWKLDYVPLFARHYPRRMDAEEIHDALVQASGLKQEYRIGGWAETVTWAWRLPDTQEPLGNEGNARVFMDSFLRGNRDTLQRTQAGSILQQLSMMNDVFVMNRIRVVTCPNLLSISRIAGNDDLVDELFLTVLARFPSETEKAKAAAYLGKATTPATRNAAIEDLTWVLINKVDFLFSY